jgi:hypothetical protein
LQHQPNDRSQSLNAQPFAAEEARSRRNLRKFAATAFGIIVGALVVSGFVIAKYDYIENEPPTLEQNAG